MERDWLGLRDGDQSQERQHEGLGCWLMCPCHRDGSVQSELTGARSIDVQMPRDVHIFKRSLMLPALHEEWTLHSMSAFLAESSQSSQANQDYGCCGDNLLCHRAPSASLPTQTRPGIQRPPVQAGKQTEQTEQTELYFVSCVSSGACLISNIPHRQQECRLYHYPRLAYHTCVESDRPPCPSHLRLPLTWHRVSHSVFVPQVSSSFTSTTEVIPVRSPNTPASTTLQNRATRNPKPCSPGRSQKQSQCRSSEGKEAAWPDAYVSSGRCVA